MTSLGSQSDQLRDTTHKLLDIGFTILGKPVLIGSLPTGIENGTRHDHLSGMVYYLCIKQGKKGSNRFLERRLVPFALNRT